MMTGGFGLRAVMIREVKRAISSKLTWLMAVIFPLFAIGLFAALFQEAVPENLPVAVLDLDRSELSASIVRMVDASPAMDVVEVSDMGAGHRALVSGGAYGLLVLSEGLSAKVKRRQAPVTPFYTNNQLMLPAGVIKRAMMKIFETLAAGVKLKNLRASGLSEEGAKDRLFGIHIASHVLFNPNLNYRWFLFASIAPFMLKIFIMCTMVWTFGGEFKGKTTGEWLKIAGGSSVKSIAGKWLLWVCWFYLITVFLFALLVGPMGLPRPAEATGLLVGGLLFVLACQSVALFFVAFTGEMARAISFTSIYAGSSFTFAGVTYPGAGMPLAARLWHEMIPLTHMVRILNEQSLKGLGLAGSLDAFMALGLMVMLFGGSALVKLSGRLGKEVA